MTDDNTEPIDTSADDELPDDVRDEEVEEEG